MIKKPPPSNEKESSIRTGLTRIKIRPDSAPGYDQCNEDKKIHPDNYKCWPVVRETQQLFGFITNLEAPTSMAKLPAPVPVSPNMFSTAEFERLQMEAKAGALSSFNGFTERQALQEKFGVTGKGLTVGIIDTGVYKHHDLKKSITARFSCTGAPNRKSDLYGHGTHIAGIIAGKNGIAPKAKIVSFKVTHMDESEATWWNIAQALRKVIRYNDEVEKNVRQGGKISVVNLSYNGFDTLTPDDEQRMQKHLIYKLIGDLYSKDVPVVVSGGNYFDYIVSDESIKDKQGLAYPAICSYVIAAGAVFNVNMKPFTVNDLAPFTQRLYTDNDENSTHTFLLAPGVDTVSCGIEGPESYTRMAGSSQAAAVVSGIVLLLQEQFYLAHGRMPTVDEVKHLLVRGSKPKQNNPIAGAAGRADLEPYFDGEIYRVADAHKSLQLV